MTTYYYQVDAKRRGKIVRSNIIPVLVPTPIPPGGGGTYGPTNGRATVIAEAGPLTVTDPGGGVPFSTWDELASGITANGVGTKFVKRGGAQTLVPTTIDVGTKNPDIWFPGFASSTSPTCAIIDAGGAQIAGIIGGTYSVHGGVWQNFGNLPDTGSRHPLRVVGDNSLIEDGLFRDNIDAGLTVGGSFCTIRRLECHSNGRNGLRANPTAESEFPLGMRGTVFENLHLWGNNISGTQLGNNAAAFKGTSLSGTAAAPVLIQKNYAHDNNSFGLWVDLWTHEASDIYWLDNVSELNWRAGIFCESVGGGCRIQRNFVKNNGITNNPLNAVSLTNGWNISVSTSDCTLGNGVRGDISLNIVDHDVFDAGDTDVGRLIGLYNTGTEARPDCKNWDVHDNQIRCRDTQVQRVGGHDGQITTNLWTGNHDWYNNLYKVASLSTSYWRWGSGASDSGTSQTWAQWQAISGAGGLFDRGSTRELI